MSNTDIGQDDANGLQPGWIKRTIDWLTSYRLLGVAIFGVFLLLATTVMMTGPQAEPQTRTEKSWPVSVTSADPNTLAPTLTAYGKVESRQVANLKASISAPVAEVVVREGAWIEKGDPLIRFDAAELRLSVDMAMAEYQRQQTELASVKTDYELAKNVTAHHRELNDIAQSRLARYQNLYKTKMVADQVLDEAKHQASERAITLEQHLARVEDFPNRIARREAAVRESKARLNRAELDLAQTEVLAPFSGRVIRTHVARGDRVPAGTPLIQVADYDALEVRAAVPSRVGDTLRSRSRKGEKVRATGNVDGREIDFVLDRLSADVKKGQSGLDAFFTTASNTTLDIGRVVNLAISLPPEPDVVPLPVQAIYGNDRVYRVEDNRLVALSVEQVGDYLDEDGNFKILVRSPQISEGDRLITTQLPQAMSGLLVDPIEVDSFEDALAGQPNVSGDTLTQ